MQANTGIKIIFKGNNECKKTRGFQKSIFWVKCKDLEYMEIDSEVDAGFDGDTFRSHKYIVPFSFVLKLVLRSAFPVVFTFRHLGKSMFRNYM